MRDAQAALRRWDRMRAVRFWAGIAVLTAIGTVALVGTVNLLLIAILGG
jgi:hypothetical protein